MVDPENISKAKSSDLMGLVGASLKKVAGTGGGEYAGECPFCGGRDRFRVQPFNPAGPRWFCRQCTGGAWKDAIDFIMRRDGLRFPNAVEYLAGVTPHMLPVHASSATPGLTQAPSPVWQECGRAFVAECQDRLWSEAGRAALKSLHGRGFSDETIRQAGLGWNDEARYDARSAWGLPPEMNDKGKPKSVWLPRGWVLPSHIDDDLWEVRIRRRGDDIAADVQQGKISKYIQIPGGANALYNADALQLGCYAVLVEGVFDALSIQQQVRDLVVPVATGSTTGARRVKWIGRLALADTVLVAFDADEAGQDAAEYWLKILQNTRRWRPWWDDPNQLAIDGADLRTWLQPALPENSRSEHVVWPGEHVEAPGDTLSGATSEVSTDPIISQDTEDECQLQQGRSEAVESELETLLAELGNAPGRGMEFARPDHPSHQTYLRYCELERQPVISSVH